VKKIARFVWQKKQPGIIGVYRAPIFQFNGASTKAGVGVRSESRHRATPAQTQSVIII
jgi:hypothetical protein